MKQEHGGMISGAGLLDLSVNLNPLGMPESVKTAAAAADWESYPDPQCTALTAELSRAEGVPAERIVCGNGAADLIYRAVHAFKPAQAVIFAPTFGEYAKALAEAGCEVREHFLREEKGFLPDERFLDELVSGTDMVIICSPNNPTGQLMPPELMKETARVCRERNITLISDECFLGFAENAGEYSLARYMEDGFIILRAFTKLYCMAGLRLGYAVCGSAETAERLRRSGQFWSVSSPAQAAGIAALREEKYLSETAALVARERAFLSESIESLGYKVFPSAADYLLFKGDAGLDDRLLSEGIVIRNCSGYSGLGEGFYRTAVRLREDNERLIKALGRCKNVKG